jgi:hypothetical protein
LDPEPALQVYRECEAKAASLGLRPLLAQCKLDQGSLLRQHRDMARAHERLVEARALFEQMEMPFWLERADAELASMS